MAITDFDNYRILVEEWNDIINCSTQINVWVKNMLNKIIILQQDTNFSSSISPAESLYITNYINVLNTYIQTQPILPPK